MQTRSRSRVERCGDAALAFGLVAHELTTNAVKYGALSQQGGAKSRCARLVATMGRVALLFLNGANPVARASRSRNERDSDARLLREVSNIRSAAALNSILTRPVLFAAYPFHRKI